MAVHLSSPFRFACLTALLCACQQQPQAYKPPPDAALPPPKDYERARWDPIHFQPAIQTAKDEDCLRCHREVIDTPVRERSTSGTVAAAEARAWYEALDTYEGATETFHRRHLSTPLARRLMKLRCTTCHQGNDPRDENPATEEAGFTLRKHVHPNVCLMCHGQMNYTAMGLPGPWPQSAEAFQNNCLLCHAGIRTTRHQVNFLQPEAIEQAAKEKQDVCYGCHGGRAWYRINYPYPRHPWPGMAPAVPDWARGRPATSEARFLVESK